MTVPAGADYLPEKKEPSNLSELQEEMFKANRALVQYGNAMHLVVPREYWNEERIKHFLLGLHTRLELTRDFLIARSSRDVITYMNMNPDTIVCLQKSAMPSKAEHSFQEAVAGNGFNQPQLLVFVTEFGAPELAKHQIWHENFHKFFGKTFHWPTRR